MSDAPNRVWRYNGVNGQPAFPEKIDGTTEYIRRDAPELVALVKAAREYRQSVLAFDGRDTNFLENLDRVNAAGDALDATLAAWEKINDR